MIVTREELLRELTAFEQSSESGFLLLADSGCGKTSALCDYATHRIEQGKPTLFFVGNTIEGNLLATLTNEFNWTFSEQVTPVALVKRLSALTKGIPMVIVLDALDEWAYPQKAQSLLGFLRGGRNDGVKIVFSCKSGAWEAISQPNGSDLGFSSYLYKTKTVDESSDAVVLSPMSSPELF